METIHITVPKHLVPSHEKCSTWILKEWYVKEKSAVHSGQTLLSLVQESMKRSIKVNAPCNGTLLQILVSSGQVLQCDGTEETVDISAGESSPEIELETKFKKDTKGLEDYQLAVFEFCPHPMMYLGVCAVCGAEDEDPKSLTSVAQGINPSRDVPGSGAFPDSNGSNLRVSVAYLQEAVSVTHKEAHRLSILNAQRMLKENKLSLVLDIDHTLLHATDDPRAQAALQVYKNDPSWLSSSTGSSPHPTPRYQKGIHSLTLPGASFPLYVKLRPGLGQFLKRVHMKFELHIYTMGTRAYADAIASLIDPNKSLFRGRITSRDDFEEGKLNQKSLRRLFPCDDSMVLIVDDREDVWRDHSSQSVSNLTRVRNLIQASPYIFFSGLHEAYDRDSKKLRPEDNPPSNAQASVVENGHPLTPSSKIEDHVPTISKMEVAPEPTSNRVQSKDDSEQGDIKEMDIVAQTSNKETENLPANGIDHKSHQDEPNKSENKENSLVTAIHDKVDLNEPMESEDKDNVMVKPSSNGENKQLIVLPIVDIGLLETSERLVEGNEPSTPVSKFTDMSTNSSLSDDLLDTIHHWQSADEVDDKHLLKLADALEKCHSLFFQAARDNKHLMTNGHVPADAKVIMDNIRKQVLQGCHIVFSGIFPQGYVPQNSRYWIEAELYGARCHLKFTKDITHVIGDPVRGKYTEKANMARKNDNIFLVTPQWLDESRSNFERANEVKFALFSDGFAHSKCTTDISTLRARASEARDRRLLTIRRTNSISPAPRKRTADGFVKPDPVIRNRLDSFMEEEKEKETESQAALAAELENELLCEMD